MMRRDSMPVNYERTLTVQGYTETRAGLIPHLQVLIGDYMFMAPVILLPRVIGNNGMLLDPKRNEDGRCLHALPGGREIVGYAP